ncbi:hypothetical protein SO802_030798 [Lithocarpus litseifolius]|uniref:Uncharacterized protein n=1 Tax=Lithocarpus litseifolius TaxID=425828 RepID=A0AAW2BL06_9ROSI
MMWEVVEQMLVKGFVALNLYVFVEPAIVEAGEGSQRPVLDETVDEHIDSISLQSYQGCAENTEDGYGSEPWQTFPHVNSIQEEEGPKKCMKESIYLMMTCMGAHPKMKMIMDLVMMDNFEELLDTMGEHEDVDHIQDVVIEDNRDTCPGLDPTPEWFTKNT